MSPSAPRTPPPPRRRAHPHARRQNSPARGLEPFRRRLDQLDEQIARLLGERFAICREIALYKRARAIPMMQPDRVAEVRSRYLAGGAAAKLPADFTAELFELLIAATCRMEDELIAQGKADAQVAPADGHDEHDGREGRDAFDEREGHDGPRGRDGLQDGGGLQEGDGLQGREP